MHSGRRLGTGTCPRPRPLLLLLLCWLMGLSEDGPFIVTVFHSQGLTSLSFADGGADAGVNPDSGVARNPLFGHFTDTSLYTITLSLSISPRKDDSINTETGKTSSGRMETHNSKYIIAQYTD